MSQTAVYAISSDRNALERGFSEMYAAAKDESSHGRAGRARADLLLALGNGATWLYALTVLIHHA